MSSIKVGEKVGHAIVVECDDMDVFGNPKPNSQPMVLESNLNDSIFKTKERVKKHLSFKRNGKVLICELVVKEIILDNQD